MASLKKALSNSAMFKRLTNDELDSILPMSRQVKYAEGETIFSEGTPAEDVYIIIEGMVSMEMKLAVYPGLAQKAMVEVLRHGDTFGWSSVLGSHVYTMTATAIEPVEAVVIDGDELNYMLAKNPDMGYRVLLGLVEVVSSRLWGVKRAVFA